MRLLDEADLLMLATMIICHPRKWGRALTIRIEELMGIH